MDDRRDYRLFQASDGRYDLREVRYDADGMTTDYSRDGIRPWGVRVEKLREKLEPVLNALEKLAVVVKRWRERIIRLANLWSFIKSTILTSSLLDQILYQPNIACVF